MRRQLDEYFKGRRRAFEVPIDWRLVRGFAGEVLRATSQILFGTVSLYREIAAEAGSPPGIPRPTTRWARTQFRSWCPATGCSTPGGGLGGYTGGLDCKRCLLHLEGVLDG